MDNITDCLCVLIQNISDAFDKHTISSSVLHCTSSQSLVCWDRNSNAFPGLACNIWPFISSKDSGSPIQSEHCWGEPQSSEQDWNRTTFPGVFPPLILTLLFEAVYPITLNSAVFIRKEKVKIQCSSLSLWWQRNIAYDINHATKMSIIPLPATWAAQPSQNMKNK